MIREMRRPLLAGERPRIERSLKRAQRGAALGVLGRMAILVAIWLFGLVVANTVAQLTVPADGGPHDKLVLRVLQLAISVLVLGAGIPILIRNLRRDAAQRRANIALYGEILHSCRMPVIEVEASRIIRLADHPDIGDAFLCEVEPRKCLFLVAGPNEEIIPGEGFPTRSFEVVSYGTGDFDTTVRPAGDVIEPDESHSAKDIHYPDWEHAEVIEKSMDECLVELGISK
jgi:hypothetical protein